jgi:hypothetical protein
MFKSFSTYWRRYLVPSPAALALVSVAGALMALGLAFGLLYAASAAKSLADGVGQFAFVFGIIVMPVVAVLLMGAAVREKRPLPRAMLWAGVALAVLVSGLTLMLGISLASEVETPLLTGVATFLFCCGPPAVVLFGLALYFAAKGWPEMRAAIAAERERRAVEMIEARGEVTLAELAAELNLRPDECDDLVEAALKAERLFGWHDAQRGRVYSAAALRARQSQLAAVVTARGQIHLDDLGRELRAPRDLVRQWVYELVKRGEFTGYLNWDEGILYSAEAQRLTEAGKCPYCNGELSLAGKGVIRCAYCGSEIFL